MIEVSSEELALHAERRGVVAHTLYWITARDRETGEPESLGLWTGDDAQAFDIGGETRTYFGPVVLDADPIRMDLGLGVDEQGLSLAHLDPATALLVRGYDIARAPVEVHSVVAHLDSRLMVAPPRLEWSGIVDAVQIHTPEDGGEGQVRLGLAPANRILTRVYPWRRSHADQTSLFPDDDFFLNSIAAMQREVPVGEHAVKGGGGIKQFIDGDSEVVR